MGDFASQLERVNQQLERVRVRIKGKRLYLRATLPPKPGDGDRDRAKQYDLSTGCTATPAGLKIARAKAQELESQIIREQFDWSVSGYLKGKEKLPETAGEWIERFEKNTGRRCHAIQLRKILIKKTIAKDSISCQMRSC